MWGYEGSKAIPTAPLGGPPYRATGVIRPPHFVRGNDPEHPKMRIPVRSRDVAHTVNILPENSEWKDHDSDADEGHPNWPVIRLQEMNSSEISEDIWDKCKDTCVPPHPRPPGGPAPPRRCEGFSCIHTV